MSYIDPKILKVGVIASSSVGATGGFGFLAVNSYDLKEVSEKDRPFKGLIKHKINGLDIKWKSNANRLLYVSNSSKSFLDEVANHLNVLKKDGYFAWLEKPWWIITKKSQTTEEIAKWCKFKYESKSLNVPSDEEIAAFNKFCVFDR
ncbi:hypothetical protein [Candidatus Mycoplasma haematohominis]|uniref:hypothetical protein n=1 Tax=Candidatus Mycoplasma haematohominis TaxID=1494318 RepID=UPI001C0A67AE|nr:hypothetical protein [Candidatus Mycoplasma haemohominis]